MTGTISRIGEDQFLDRRIDGEILRQFVSKRLEGLTLQFFHRMAVSGQYSDIEDYGSYWYDDPTNKKSVGFDCVIKRSGNLYDFYECKYFDRPMTLEECEQEKEQLIKMNGIEASKIGFVCTGGFVREDIQGFVLIDGEDLYQTWDVQ